MSGTMHTQEVMLIHEIESVQGREVADDAADIALVQRGADRRFEQPSIRILKLPEHFELKPDVSYRVDPASNDIREVPA